MTRDRWLISLALLLLIGLGGVCWQQTQIREQERRLAVAQARVDEAAATAYWLRMRYVRPYCPPLEELWISSGVGYRLNPMGGDTESLHKGVDLVASIGTPVRAVRSGIVAEHWVPPDGGHWKGHPIMGGMLIIDHGGFYAEYAHLSKTFVHEGDSVIMGQIIGLVGNTGVSTGSHLHFEIILNPLEYLCTTTGGNCGNLLNSGM